MVQAQVRVAPPGRGFVGWRANVNVEDEHEHWSEDKWAIKPKLNLSNPDDELCNYLHAVPSKCLLQ